MTEVTNAVLVAAWHTEVRRKAAALVQIGGHMTTC